MDSFNKNQIIEEIRRIYDLQLRDLQLQINTLTNFTDCLLEYTVKNSPDPKKSKDEIEGLFSKAPGRDKVHNYIKTRLKEL